MLVSNLTSKEFLILRELGLQLSNVDGNCYKILSDDPKRDLSILADVTKRVFPLAELDNIAYTVQGKMILPSNLRERQVKLIDDVSIELGYLSFSTDFVHAEDGVLYGIIDTAEIPIITTCVVDGVHYGIHANRKQIKTNCYLPLVNKEQVMGIYNRALNKNN